MGDKGVATAKIADNAVTTAKILDGAVNSAKIADDSIVNADVKSNAAIAGTKISPNFGAQNLATSGNVSAAGFLGSGAGLSGVVAAGVFP